MQLASSTSACRQPSRLPHSPLIGILAKLLFGTLLVLCWACSSKPAQLEEGTPQALLSFSPENKNPLLTRTEALERFDAISNVHYTLFFDLATPEVEPAAKKKTYAGKVKIQFTSKQASFEAPLRLDFYDGIVESLTVNGKRSSIVYNGHFLVLSPPLLKAGENSIEVVFRHKYSNTGDGLHRFEDPEDGRSYIFSNLEPFDANQVFPCFDQPDLKATYTMSVIAPERWQVITSVRESSKPQPIERRPGVRLWQFPTSAKFSTYIWSLHAGDFYVWEKKDFRYPLRLFARQSMAKYVKPRSWFEPTEQGFDFFEEYFGVVYPYKKYDQLIVPEFSSGAMENVAAVTFNERFIKRGSKTRQQLLSQTDVILHEMAHMWFGNLVTMKWWDDLWLNESFATYLANVALARVTEFKEAPLDFHGTKNWAYGADQAITTHPIFTPVPSTATAMANFDGITYGKGASVLKQLHFNVSDANFSKGLRYYFVKYAEGNTTIDNFLDSFAKITKRELRTWKKKWLETVGVNTLAAQGTCHSGKYVDFTLRQAPSSRNSVIRPHRTKIALFDLHSSHSNEGEERLVFRKAIPVLIEGKSIEVPELVGEKCADVIYPNYEDYAFAKVALDKKSFVTLNKHLSSIQSSLTRLQMWNDLWQMVRNHQLSVKEFATAAVTHLPVENNAEVLKDLLIKLHGYWSERDSVVYYLPDQSASDKEFKQRFIFQLETFIWRKLTSAKPGSEMQKQLFDSYLRAARSNRELTRIQQLLAGKVKIKGLPLDQDKRWHMVIVLAKFGAPGAKQAITAELRRDKSDRGEKSAVAAEASLPDWSIKQKWIDSFTKKDKSYKILQSAIYSLFPANQDDLRMRFKEHFFHKLEEIKTTHSSHEVRAFVFLAPANCNESTSASLTAFLAKDSLQDPLPLKRMRRILDENQKCQKIKELASKQSNPGVSL